MKSENLNKILPVPIIDLFAGPGGLAEGFSAVEENGDRFFKIGLSIEKEEKAHKTLLLRSFCRQFSPGNLPPEYYKMLSEPTEVRRDKAIESLYKLYDTEFSKAKKEAWKAELGGKEYPPEMVDYRIREAIGDYKNWVLIGGPPCQAYSLVGRSRVGGISVEDHRVYLYQEYLRIIAKHQPAVFVMENVKGLLSAKLNGDSIFEKILKDLQDPASVFKLTHSKKYRIFSFVKDKVSDNTDFLIKSEFYGIPQKRHRVILLGIREDLKIIPETLAVKNQLSLESVISNLPKIRSRLNRQFISSESVNGKKCRKYQDVIDSNDQWQKIINSFKDEVLKWNAFEKYDGGNSISAPVCGTGAEFLSMPSHFSDDHPLRQWYSDSKLTGITHHNSRSHLVEDLRRYLFSCIFSATEKRFPRLSDYDKFSERLMPDHNNAASGKFDDRFRVQLPDTPATTVTSHISKDGHYFIHYDPSQCRSLTVREAARVQTFPDNYLFCGSRTAQFHQVGNAVPPYLAFQIAIIVKEIMQKI